uniref:Uncharacterized protein n=1 Tax=Phlegmariurus squarrosus TaxID=73615 RepID=H9M8B5_PHLSQ|nr:hypothetical protein HusqMp36 [Phlegmariurus squarrosus]AEV55822.1 hypothetical protein HusqMp36 [Phlegmariurus squarrosus]
MDLRCRCKGGFFFYPTLFAKRTMGCFGKHKPPPERKSRIRSHLRRHKDEILEMAPSEEVSWKDTTSRSLEGPGHHFPSPMLLCWPTSRIGKHADPTENSKVQSI